MDVHGESSVTWEDVSNYFIEQGMSGFLADWSGVRLDLADGIDVGG